MCIRDRISTISRRNPQSRKKGGKSAPKKKKKEPEPGFFDKLLISIGCVSRENKQLISSSYIFLLHFDHCFSFTTSRLQRLSLIHISEPTRRTPISYAVFCLKKKKHC
eukprot:TRINITY_DN12804_c0_g1_i1.p1 TRINITY_DN12804_c0_g1~~TRINITY_DN12804_c0_g1_i1.p1  ORF type:complete len:108 (-),score=20.09 TRINITY_DN12804_c0_g1_i1:28-351(-)